MLVCTWDGFMLSHFDWLTRLVLSNRSWLCEPFQRTICKMGQKRAIKAEHQHWHDRSILAKHEEARTKRFENQQSMAFGVRTLLVVALHQYVQEPFDIYRRSCPQSAQLKVYQNRMAGMGKQAEGCDCKLCFSRQELTKISISPARNTWKKTTQWNYDEKT